MGTRLLKERLRRIDAGLGRRDEQTAHKVPPHGDRRLPDVSRERKRTEKALRENEEALRIAQEIAHLGHWRYAVPTGEIWWSDELYRIFDGLDRGGDPLTLAAVLARVHPDDATRSGPK